MKSLTQLLTDLKLAKLNSNFILALMFLLSTNSLLAQITKRTTTKVNLRSSPNPNSEIIKVLPANTDVIAVYDWDENWTQVNSMETIGYVSSKYLAASSNPYELWEKVDYATGQEPEVVYMAYVAKTISGYVVRLVFRANEYFEIEEDFMTIMYEGDD